MQGFTSQCKIFKKIGIQAFITTNNIHPTESKAGQCEIDTFQLFLAQSCLAELVPHLAHEHLVYENLLAVAALRQDALESSCSSTNFFHKVFLFINQLLPQSLLVHQPTSSTKSSCSSTNFFPKVLLFINQLLPQSPLVHQPTSSTKSSCSSTNFFHKVFLFINQLLPQSPLVHQPTSST